ncbi:Hypothetical protein SCF082_LOCUS20801 [Durusdinium trenchii]|uniref:EF-hand domain-containing protein n=1 Tax=Durusdinium trenchii TaxID=1381693 RepID=A0ABP0L659_9DINO
MLSLTASRLVWHLRAKEELSQFKGDWRAQQQAQAGSTARDIDVDKSGAIDYEEFIQDGSGSIELKEFIVVLSRYTAAKTEKLKFAFMMFDEDSVMYSSIFPRWQRSHRPPRACGDVAGNWACGKTNMASFVVEGFSPEELEERADKVWLPGDPGRAGDFLKLASAKNGLIYPVEEERRTLGANHGEETLEGLIQQVSMNTALLRTLLPVLSNLPTANKMASLLAGQAEVTNSHGAYNSNGPAPLPANSLQDNFSDLAAQGVMDFFEYVPNSLEVFVGQMLELWPPVTQMRGMIFAVAPRLPAGLSLDERSGLLHGRPQERTVGQVTYFITACNPQRTPTKVSVALVKLTVNHAFDHTMQY